ncbi:MAG: PIN domain-containing protein [Steroidobacteraceae bacterium]
MSETFILIDFENVQPKNLAQMRGRPVRLRIFVGSQQAKVPFDLAQTVQALGERAEYVQIAGTGRNALDLHIAYYVGRLVVQHPGAEIYILSKDRDYDILLKHLHAQGIRCHRKASLDEIPALKVPSATKPAVAPDRLAPVITHLRNLKASRPRKVKTLASTLKARFAKDGGEREVQALIEELRQRGLIAVEATNVTYRLD